MPELTKYQNEMRVDNYVQSVLLDKKQYKLIDVCPVVLALGYNCFYIDESDNHYRVRQFNPDYIRNRPNYKTVVSSKLPGVQYVIQY
jgi:hypothetical protein